MKEQHKSKTTYYIRLCFTAAMKVLLAIHGTSLIWMILVQRENWASPFSPFECAQLTVQCKRMVWGSLCMHHRYSFWSSDNPAALHSMLYSGISKSSDAQEVRINDGDCFPSVQACNLCVSIYHVGWRGVEGEANTNISCKKH